MKQLDIANFELFSSTPKDFLVSISDRYEPNVPVLIHDSLQYLHYVTNIFTPFYVLAVLLHFVTNCISSV